MHCLNSGLAVNKKTQKQLEEYLAKPPRLLKRPLDKNELIAYINSPNLGDSLIGLVTVNNLIRNGYKVDVFGDYAYSLRDWFPSMSIFPAIKVEEQPKLAQYPTVLHMHERAISKAIESWHPHSVVLYHESLFRLLLSEIDLQTITCKVQLGLNDVVRGNNITPLRGLIADRHDKRVMLHPTSTAVLRNWPEKKFVQLSKMLIDRGFTPHFIVSPGERPVWEKIVYDNAKLPEETLPNFASLSDVAAWLYESGYFIGNDSGIGHLASNVGLPTLSIIIRKSLAIHWHPDFNPAGVVVLPPAWLLPRFIKEKFWKQCTSVSRVLKKFNKLRTLKHQEDKG
jgi:ADP-heptose:LPS heptosyltransferase